MGKIYCSSCELARIFELKESRRKLYLPMWIGKDSEPKNNGKDLLQQLGIGQCFWAEETKEKADLAGVFRQGFWAEEQWKENYRSSSESARILNLRNNGEMLIAAIIKSVRVLSWRNNGAMYLRPFCQSARILHRDPEGSENKFL